MGGLISKVKKKKLSIINIIYNFCTMYDYYNKSEITQYISNSDETFEKEKKNEVVIDIWYFPFLISFIEIIAIFIMYSSVKCLTL